MNAHIFLAPAAAGKTQYCIDHICTVRNNERLVPIWVILPDAAQVRAFRRRLAGAGGAFNVHVVTFATLYAELLVLAGEALPRLDEPILHRLLRAIVDELVADGRIIYYTPLQDKPGFFQVLRRVIRELKQARIEPETLLTAVADQPLRWQELALIYDQYQGWLQQNKWADDEGRGWLAALALKAQPDLCADWRLLVVDGFDEFNPTQLAVLGRLSQQAQETMTTLTGADAPRLAHQRFARARASLEAALQTPATLSPTKAVHLAPPLAHLEATLFESAAPTPPVTTAALTLLELPNRAQEVRAALRWLKQRHIHGGVPLDQMAVLARDLEVYRPFLEEMAVEFGLPLQMAQGVWLHQNPAVAALLDLLALPWQNWPRRLLLEAWRSPYFDWSHQHIIPADADLLAAAAHEGQIIAGLNQWREVLGRLAKASSPADAGYTAEETLAETAVLTAPRGPQAADLRRKFDAFINKLQPEPQATMRHYVGWLETLLGDDPALASPRQLWQLGASLGVVAQARTGPDGQLLLTAERDVAALQRLKDVLRSLVFTESAISQSPRPQSMISYGHFWQELRGAVEAATYRPPPPKEQAVLLAAPVLAARGLAFQAAALLGLGEGEFPRQPPRNPLLRGPDRDMLDERGVALAGHDMGDEATLFYEAITRARRQLLVTRTYLADDGQPWEPSPYWQQLQRHSQAEPVRLRSAALLPKGWLGQLGAVVGLDRQRLDWPLAEPCSLAIEKLNGRAVGCTVSPLMPLAPSETVAASTPPEIEAEVIWPPPLLTPVTAASAVEEDERLAAREADPPPRVWRVVPTTERPRGPAWVVGALFHEALRRWYFPSDVGFDGLMRLHAQEKGLTDEAEIEATIGQVDHLLRRFQRHELFPRIATACRYHEVPYVIEREGRSRCRIIDLLYEDNGRWTVVDFKTDRLDDEKALHFAMVAGYREQVREYVTAVNEMLGVVAAGQLCFLDVGGRVWLEPVNVA